MAANIIPVQVNDDSRSLHNIGAFIMSYQPYMNAFCDAIVNRIAYTIVTSKSWQNPWARFKRGTIDLGESVEEIFANIAKPYSFDPEQSQTDLYKRRIPDVRAAFHTMNWQKVYPVTISQEQLRTAFLSWNGITDLIAKITESLYTSLSLDEFLTMKYMLAREILNGGFYVQAHNAIDTDPDDAIVKYRQLTNDLTFLKTKFNRAGVRNSTEVADQVIIMPNDVEAKLGVNVLANAFQLNQVDYIGNRVPLDTWAFDADDTARLAELFGDDSSYVPFTADENAILAKVSAFKGDKNVFMIFDNLEQMTQAYNGLGLYWNYFLHAWKTFSISPYHNGVVFTESASTITGVTVSPTTATVKKGGNATFTATVKGTGLYDKQVVWSLGGANAEGTAINPNNGVLNVSTKETSTSLTITATASNGIKATATVTVS